MRFDNGALLSTCACIAVKTDAFFCVDGMLLPPPEHSLRRGAAHARALGHATHTMCEGDCVLTGEKKDEV